MEFTTVIATGIMVIIAVGALVWLTVDSYKKLESKHYKKTLRTGIITLVIGAIVYLISFWQFKGYETFEIGGFVCLVLGGQDVLICILKRHKLKNDMKEKEPHYNE